MGTRVVFRRIGGRIIPMVLKATPGVAIGGTAGMIVGQVAGASRLKGDQESLKKAMSKNQVNVVSAVRRSGVKNVNVISTQKALKKHLGPFKSRTLLPHLKMAQKGSNAFALRTDGKDFIITAKKANPLVVGHELGHIKDFRRNGTPGFFASTFGSVTGSTLEREKTAWKISPFKHRHFVGCGHALGTYEKNQTNSRIGAALGAISGALWKLKR